MCSQTIHYATKGEITGMIAACNGNFINPGRAVFARERCDNLVWRASQYFQNMLGSVSGLKHLVSPSHSNLYTQLNSLSEDSRKHTYQVNLDGRGNCLPKRSQIIF